MQPMMTYGLALCVISSNRLIKNARTFRDCKDNKGNNLITEKNYEYIEKIQEENIEKIGGVFKYPDFPMFKEKISKNPYDKLEQEINRLISEYANHQKVSFLKNNFTQLISVSKKKPEIF